MKAKLIQLLAITIILATAVTGCKRKPQNVTPLPGARLGQMGGDRPTGPIDTAPVGPGTTGPGSTAIGPEGIPPTDPGTMLTWPQDREAFRAQTVLFDFDKSTVRASEISKLETVASRMKSEFAGKALLIEGHADERGTEEYNRALGERRALAVRESLVKLGLDANIIVTLTMGEDQPADPGHNEAAWSKNRRGEIILLNPPAGGAATSSGTQ